jgi:hypothetical protein
MLDWVGSLRIREQTPLRVVLSLSRATRFAGWLLLVAAGYAAWQAWPLSPWLAAGPLMLVGIGLFLATMHRELVFDRSEGVLRIEQGAFGIPNRKVVPLFHLRAVVIVARSERGGAPVVKGSRYVAFIERRVGDTIYLDESRRCARLVKMAKAISEAAELTFEYDATGKAS